MRKKLLIFSLLIFFIPYLGAYRLYPFVFFLFVLFFMMFNGFKFRKQTSLFCMLFLFQLLWMSLSVFFNTIFYSVPFSLSDYSEFARPLFVCFVVLFYFNTYIVLDKESTSKILVVMLSVITVFNASLMIFGILHIDVFKFFISVYGEAPIYSYGYSGFRAFGIIGQPGKAALFSATLCFVFLYFNDKKIYLSISRIMFFLNFICVLFTFSRTGLVGLFFLIFMYFMFINRKLKRLFVLLFIIFIGVIFLVNYQIIDLTLFNRGLNDGELGTLGYRMYLKKWSWDFINSNFGFLLWGTGPSKEWISSFSTTVASDLTLKNPDSSATLWMLRYGVIGSVVFYAPYFLLLNISYKVRKYNKESMYVFVLSIFFLFISNFDPAYHEPKTQILFWTFSSFILNNIYNEKKYFSTILNK